MARRTHHFHSYRVAVTNGGFVDNAFFSMAEIIKPIDFRSVLGELA